MIKGKRVLAWIPARGGSKGIKDKNIKLLLGKPLIAYSIEAALESEYVDSIIVSTDSQQIADVAINYGACVPGLRPSELASDTSKTIDALMYTVHQFQNDKDKFDIICLLQPTSPLRTANDIDSALRIFADNGFEKDVVSVSLVKKHPILMRKILQDGSMESLLNISSTVRRQDMPDIYEINGAVYVNLTERLNNDISLNDNQLPYIMEEINSVDIDDMKDFILAGYLLEQRLE